MKKITLIFIICLGMLPPFLHAQTDSDGLVMSRNNLCSGLTYSYGYWDEYWEGTFKRENENLGKVSTSAISAMGNYGIRDRLNIIFSLPYIKTKASAGTLIGQQGLQDISLYIKWLPVMREFKKGTLSVFTVFGGSTPSHNYIADFLPMSIGLKSSTVNLRLMADYQVKNFFLTASGSYIYRSNIKIDRTAYYTDKLIYSNEVFMPNVITTKAGIGFRKKDLIFEGIVDSWNTLKGFDIRKNDMPFPSNKMNMTRVGINLKIPIPKLRNLAFIANSFYTISGRNVGQTISATAGVFYVFNVKKSENKTEQPQQ